METAEQKKSSILRKSSRKSPAIKNEIVARRLMGQNKTQIARDLGIAKNTVSSVIELNDVDRMLEDGRIGTMQRVPEALKTLDVRLEKNSESAALWLLDKCFDNSKVQGNKMSADVVLNQTLNVLLKGNAEPVSKEITVTDTQKAET